MAAKLIILDGADKGRELKINKKIFTMGRNTENDLILMDDLTSRLHARIMIEASGLFVVKDNNSRNGIFVNGERTTNKVLDDGDVIQIGRNRLAFKTGEMSVDGKVEIVTHAENIAPGKQYLEKGPSYSIPGYSYNNKEDLEENDPTNIVFKPQTPATQNKDHKIALNALQQAASALKNSEDENLFLRSIVQIILQTIDLDRGAIFLFDNSDKKDKPHIFHSVGKGSIKSENCDFTKIHDFLRSNAKITITSSDKIGFIKDLASPVSLILAPFSLNLSGSGLIYIEASKDKTYSKADIDLISTLSDIASAGIERSKASKEVKMIRRQFSNIEKHLSPEIVKAISQRDDKLLENPFDATEKEVTVLFSDIVNFTSLSEKLTAPEIAELLNEYFSRMVSVIIKNKGTINKFIGDAIMAIFGAPIAHGNDPLNAVNAGLEMIDALHDFHKQVDVSKRFNIRIGINTGTVVAGITGSAQRMEYTVLGDTVNCASRIEHIAPVNNVAIGELTFEKTKASFDCESTGEVKVKGKAKPINVYLVKNKIQT